MRRVLLVAGGMPASDGFPLAVSDQDLHRDLLLRDQAESDAMPAITVLDEVARWPDVHPRRLGSDAKTVGLDARDELIRPPAAVCNILHRPAFIPGWPPGRDDRFDVLDEACVVPIRQAMVALLQGLIQRTLLRLMWLDFGVPVAADDQAECALAAKSAMVERHRPIAILGAQILLGKLDCSRIDKDLRVRVTDCHARGPADPQQPEARALYMNA